MLYLELYTIDNYVWLIRFVLLQSEFQTQKEAAWAITNLTISGNSQQVDCVINAGVVSPLCALLSCQDSQVIQVVLDGLQNMLKIAGPDVDSLANLIEECEGKFVFS